MPSINKENTKDSGGNSNSNSPPALIKYPRTEHLFDTGGTATTSDDLVVSDHNIRTTILEAFCRSGVPVTVEEKVDGANLGIRVINNELLVQNRSHYIFSGDHAQFSMIQPWLHEHRESLMELLGSERLILYGEWCVARHSLSYDRLPGYFVAFDLFDLEAKQFYSRPRFHSALQKLAIPVVPTIGVQAFGDSVEAPETVQKERVWKNVTEPKTKKVPQPQSAVESLISSIRSLLNTPSLFRTEGTVEGVVLRQDSKDWLIRRFKVVRSDFVAGCTTGHWSRRPIEKQRIDFAFALSYLEQCYVFSGESAQQTAESCSKEQSHNSATSAAATSKQRKTQESHDRASKDTLKSRRRRVPRCIMLMGLPGSGKSYFSQRLTNALNQDDKPCGDHGTRRSKRVTVIANQDSLGRRECLRVASRASSNGVRVIVERCNLAAAERHEWIQCMHSPPASDIALVYFAASPKTCTQRVAWRLNHRLPSSSNSRRIIEELAAGLEVPTEDERLKVFSTVETVCTWQDANELLYKWGVELAEDS